MLVEILVLLTSLSTNGEREISLINMSNETSDI